MSVSAAWARELLLDSRARDVIPNRVVPARVGVPFSFGQVFDPQQIRIVDEQGRQKVSQQTTLSKWPDGSIRWRLIEFAWDCTIRHHVAVDEAVLEHASPPEAKPLIELRDDGSVAADTASRLELYCRRLRRSVSPQIYLRHDGRDYWGTYESPRCLASGPIRWSQQQTVCFHADGDASPLVGEIITNVFADSPVVTFEFVIRNPRAMGHPGGNWDLGAAGSVIIEDLSVRFPLFDRNDSDDLSIDLCESGQTYRATQRLKIFQASSGGDNWNSHNHLDRYGKIPLEFRGYKVYADSDQHDGLRAKPIVRLGNNSLVASVACRDFWQNFPKVLEVDQQTLRIGLFPAEAIGGVELQGGEQKTHQFAFELKVSEKESTLEAYLDPPIVKLSPADYADSEALPYLAPLGTSHDERYEGLVDQAIEGSDCFHKKSEVIDQFGWRNFGDIYGDHEAVYHRGDEPMVSHYNNQYDCTLGFAIQFLRSGDSRWFDLMTRMADHAWDIDTYHTEQDKLQYNGGLFWHTYHYAAAHTATHRSYPRRLRVSQSFDDGQDLSAMGETGDKLAKNYAIGGGPAASHNYSTGWMVAYWLTGDERYRTAAIDAAEYVMRIEDGQRTPFRWLSRAETGASTCSLAGYYGPGRASANSTHALLTGHELSGNEKYLARVASLMRRTVHPRDDIEALDLLNAELRWFYTMYLQALGRFVDYKDLLNQHDEDYSYGVASLLHYAAWMAKHERPTLATPEQLQYPTETWAAQDIRKWHVLQHAARYQPDHQERVLLEDKAEFFFDYVCDALQRFATRSLCRPVVLMLNFGWQRDWFLANQEQKSPGAPALSGFGDKVVFEPQRAIAVRRFKRLCVALAVGLLVAASGVVLWATSKG